MQETQCHDGVRACEPTYAAAPLEKAGIKVLYVCDSLVCTQPRRNTVRLQELPFPDGDPPPEPVLAKWLDLCKKEFDKNDNSTIAVHCVAGLGR